MEFPSKRIALPAPKYPKTTGPAPAQGAVAVVVTIDESGKVISAHALSGHPALRGPSTEAALGARFTPPERDGRQIKVTGVLSYDFTPGKKPRPKLPSHVMHP